MHSIKQKQIVQLIQAGQNREALTILEDHLRDSPDDWYAYYMSGVAYRFMGDFDRAVSSLIKATKLNPGEAQVLLALGIAHQMAGQFEEAIDSLKQSIVSKQNLVEVYNSLGLTYRKMGRFKEALESYEEGTNCLMDFVYAEVHKNPSMCYRDEVIDGKATRTVLPYVFLKTQELLKSDLRYAALRNNAGVCLAELGDLENARELFKESIELTPDGYDYPDPVRNLENYSG